METFKPLPSPLDCYEVGNCGTVRTKASGRILSSSVGRDGYVRMGLHKGFGKVKIAYVHRLIALAHVPGDITLTVNHKDLNKQNNHASNLEWITLSDNHKHLHAQRPELATARRLRVCKPVVALRLCDGVSEAYPSARDAAHKLGSVSKAGNICHALQGGTVAYGRTWEYVTKA